jgi:hypothetical protein
MKTLILISILLQAPSGATSSIGGRVTVIPNAPVPAQLTLRIYGQGTGPGLNLQSVRVQNDGSFEIRGVSPGEYSLTSGDPLLSPGRNFTFRNGDVTDFELKVPVEISGRIAMADGSTVALPSLMVTATSPVNATNLNPAAAKTMSSRATTGFRGDFTLLAFPGENTIRIEQVPTGYVVKSVTYGSMDLQSSPLTLGAAPAATIVITLDRAGR